MVEMWRMEEKEGKKDESDSEPDEIEELTNPNSKKNGDKKKKADQKKEAKSKKKAVAVTDEEKENERTIFLQRVLLDYLAVNSGEVDQAIMNARHFYIGQWYRDANALGKAPKARKIREQKVPKKKRHPDDSTSEEESASEEEENPEDNLSDRYLFSILK